MCIISKYFYFIIQPVCVLWAKLRFVSHLLASITPVFVPNVYMSIISLFFSFSQAPVQSNDLLSLETITSVDQLLQLLYPEYSVIQQCLRKRSWHDSSSPSSPSLSASSMSPLLNANNQDMWVQMREEALYKVDDTLRGKRRACTEVVSNAQRFLCVLERNYLIWRSQDGSKSLTKWVIAANARSIQVLLIKRTRLIISKLIKPTFCKFAGLEHLVPPTVTHSGGGGGDDLQPQDLQSLSQLQIPVCTKVL